MTRGMPRRIAVIAYLSRSREQTRRVLRALGHAPLVFAGLDEFLALGADASRLDALILGDAPDVDSQGRPVVECALNLTGSGVPVLHAQMQKQVRSRRRTDEPSHVQVASARYFSDLYRLVQFFLDAHQLMSVPRQLAWGSYSFRPLEKVIAFDGTELNMDAVDFDVAIEFFFNAGHPVDARWLTRMLPSGEHGASWHRIDNLDCTIDELRVALALDGSGGWRLEHMAEAGYLLMSVQPSMPDPGHAGDPPRPSRLAVGRRVSWPTPELST